MVAEAVWSDSLYDYGEYKAALGLAGCQDFPTTNKACCSPDITLQVLKGLQFYRQFSRSN
jgi:hypothetical protein